MSAGTTPAPDTALARRRGGLVAVEAAEQEGGGAREEEEERDRVWLDFFFFFVTRGLAQFGGTGRGCRSREASASRVIL